MCVCACLTRSWLAPDRARNTTATTRLQQGHQAAEPVAGPGDARAQALRLRLRQVPRCVLPAPPRPAPPRCPSYCSCCSCGVWQGASDLHTLLEFPYPLTHRNVPHPPTHRPTDGPAACSQGRAERVVHLLAVLPCAGAHLRVDQLHHVDRHLVGGLRGGGAAAGPPALPGGLGRGPAGGDHQGAGHAHAGGDPGHEPQLHRVQVPPDQGPPLEQGPCRPAYIHARLPACSHDHKGGGGEGKLCPPPLLA